MDRKVWWIVGVTLCLAIAAVCTGLSYVTSAGDETRWGMRVARWLGIKAPVVPLTFIDELEVSQRGGLNGLLHLALMQLPDEGRWMVVAYLNMRRQVQGAEPIANDDLASFTESFRLAALILLEPQERSEVLASLNAHRAAMGLEPITEEALFTPVMD